MAHMTLFQFHLQALQSMIWVYIYPDPLPPAPLVNYDGGCSSLSFGHAILSCIWSQWVFHMSLVADVSLIINPLALVKLCSLYRFHHCSHRHLCFKWTDSTVQLPYRSSSWPEYISCWSGVDRYNSRSWICHLYCSHSQHSPCPPHCLWVDCGQHWCWYLDWLESSECRQQPQRCNFSVHRIL